MFPLDETSGRSGASWANFADRAVLVPNGMSGRGDWEIKPWAASRKLAIVLVYAELVLIGGIEFCDGVYRYMGYLRKIYPLGKLFKTIANKMKFVTRAQESRDSTRATIVPTWVGNQFRPVIVRLIGGDPESLSALGVIENCVCRMMPGIVTFTSGSANVKFWIVMWGISGYSPSPRRRADIQNWEIVLRKWEITIYTR